MQGPDNCLVPQMSCYWYFGVSVHRKQTSIDHTGGGWAGVHLPPVSGPPKLILTDHPIQDFAVRVSVIEKQGQSCHCHQWLSVPDKLQGLPNQASLFQPPSFPLICAYFSKPPTFPWIPELFDILSVNSFLLRLARWISFVFNQEPLTGNLSLSAQKSTEEYAVQMQVSCITSKKYLA